MMCATGSILWIQGWEFTKMYIDFALSRGLAWEMAKCPLTQGCALLWHVKRSLYFMEQNSPNYVQYHVHQITVSPPPNAWSHDTEKVDGTSTTLGPSFLRTLDALKCVGWFSKGWEHLLKVPWTHVWRGIGTSRSPYGDQQDLGRVTWNPWPRPST